MTPLVERLARLRVPLGFLCAIGVLWAARPTRITLIWGCGMAAIGELLRIWAAGHLNKAREVTSSGPYRYFAHPLYVGSTLMAGGLVIASGSFIVAAIVVAYLGTTISAAILNEESFLRRKFGDRYDRYRRGADDPETRTRRFSMTQAIANREHRALAGLLLAILLLTLRARGGW